MALEEQDPGLVSAAVAWVEAARGVGQARVGVCGSPLVVVALDLAGDLEAEVRRVRVEETEQEAAKEAARVQRVAAAVVPVPDLVGLVQAKEGLEGLGVRERAFQE